MVEEHEEGPVDEPGPLLQGTEESSPTEGRGTQYQDVCVQQQQPTIQFRPLNTVPAK